LFARQAGPAALLAGGLIIVAQLLMMPFDPKNHIETTQSVQFQIGGAIYMAGFVALAFALIGAHGWQASRSGRFGVFATATALAGTMMLGGDLWFETFAMPWLADAPTAQQVFDTDPTVVLGLGAVASYVLFAAGWALFGIASVRARVFPKAVSIALVVGGVIGFNALLAPFGIPLAVAVAALGAWMVRTTSARRHGPLPR
jgi:hypothetical protein